MKKVCNLLFTLLFVMGITAGLVNAQPASSGTSGAESTDMATPSAAKTPGTTGGQGATGSQGTSGSQGTTGGQATTGTQGATGAAGQEISATVEGYLADVSIGKAGSTDTTGNPVSMKDLKAADANAGYGIFVYDQNTKKYKFYTFDPDSNAIVKKDIIDKGKDSVEPVFVQVQGRINSTQNTIAVESIKKIDVSDSSLGKK
jgi:hypothetical protein